MTGLNSEQSIIYDLIKFGAMIIYIHIRIYIRSNFLRKEKTRIDSNPLYMNSDPITHSYSKDIVTIIFLKSDSIDPTTSIK